MTIRAIIPYGWTASQSDIDDGSADALTGGSILIVDASGQATGKVYEAGPAGQSPSEVATSSTVASAVSKILVKDWVASTAVDADEVRRATVAAGTIETGDLIRSNSARTTGATFDATEAGFWTEISPDIVTSVAGRTGAVVLTEFTDGSVQALFDTVRADAVHQMAAATDLNTLTGTGWYNIQNATNGPAGGGWYYYFNGVHRSTPTGAPATNYGFQLAKRLDLAGTNNLLMRVNTNNSWTAWTTLATTADVDLKANIASPALTGTPTAPTAAVATNTTQIATTAFVQAATAALVDTSPATLDTLNELAAALGDDPNYAATMTTALGLKAPLASPAFTGTPTGITQAHVGLGNADNTADTAKPVSTAQQTALDLKADNTDLTDSSINVRARTIATPAVEYDAGLDTNAMVLTGAFNIAANANMPNATDWFYLENFIHRTSNAGNAATPAYQYQRATGMNAATTAGRTWQRIRNNGTWTAWREITRAVAGGGTLAAGTATITDAAATTTSRIMVTKTGGVATGVLRVSTKSAGSFVVTSSDGADTGTFDYVVFN